MSVGVPDPTEDFPRLFGEYGSEDAILARMVDDANEGLDPAADGDALVDTREGGHWRTVLMPAIREFARLYDLAGTEVPMSGFVVWAWEVYLDDLAAAWDVYRVPASQSRGTETFAGPEGTVIDAGTTVSVVPSTPDDPAPTFEVVTGGTIGPSLSLDLAIIAVEGGLQGDVAAGAITAPETPLPAGVTITNAAATSGGADVESDDSLRGRTLEAVQGKGPGVVRDYVRWAGAWPGVGKVSVTPVWSGASTVLVMVADEQGQSLDSAIVSALQADLDPDPAKGAGTAPVGAHVTVATSTLLSINVVASGMEYESGYSWDGAGGTIAVEAGISAQIVSYLLTVVPGGEVVHQHVLGILATYPGVHDVAGVTLNGLTANVAVPISPPRLPVLNSIAAS